ncbi:carboxypeptidase-like regulatory domain-containing protein [Fulvivirga sediminis]|uniref:Carboxypeptidase-like regulatory domain-containing protein n=1 Tax=Fulvivirga sediminis TaxID=2803949 RepID=A0A937K033_9BACT|nr:carboxypeptidase-like regulatory domain-containing protein [Fulvivirga sediminis]MBL3657249.1 carboxypeptidase-like regulatory domain-containing protein [Fulvivirga sediminis]
MKKQLKLSVAQPCSQNWSEFTPTERGGFCDQCQMEVIDFTQMTEDDIKNYFTSLTSNKRVCGRLKTPQLNTPFTPKFPKTGVYSYMKAAAVSLTVLLSASVAMAQAPFVNEQINTKTTIVRPEMNDVIAISLEKQVVKGVVKDQEGEVMPGVNIVLQGTEIGTATDINGYFEFPQPLDQGDVLIFSFIGYESVAYNVPSQVSDQVEISLNMEAMEMLGEITFDHVYEEPSGIAKVWNKLKAIF